MKNLYFLAILFLGVYVAHSQNQRICGTSEVMNQWMEANPEKAKQFLVLQNEAEEQSKNGFSLKMNAATVYTIPVVFHVIHLNGSENISDAQIQDALNILNRDFRKLNADTSSIVNEFKGLAADVGFEFRLATKDENGNCTNGITRHYDARTNWVADFSNYVYTWDNTRYLNIYVVKTITSGAAGYTFLPGTVGWSADAIVIRHDYTGSIGTAFPFGQRSLTHEVGHWFNLQHVWGLTNNPGVACGDDGVSDTPITKGFTGCNLSGAANCNPPIKENVQNYMDYSFCGRMFTIGQATRMNNAALSPTGGRNNLHTTSNLIATGVINPISPCAPKPDFMADKTEACLGDKVTFTDLSYNGAITNWNWSFAGGSPATSTLQNAFTNFTQSGLVPVQLKVSNSVGADSLIKKLVTVLPGPGSGTNNIAQGFETITFPDNNWIKNYPTIGSGWIQTNTVGATGSNCVMIDNYLDSPSDPCLLYTPMYDISTLPNPALTFNVAHSQNAGGSDDRLRVYASFNCANSWVLLYNKSGANLHTLGAGNYASGAFKNPLTSQWRKETVSLSSYSSVTNLLLKFEFKKDSLNPGNNIFLDDINLESASGINELNAINYWEIYPNPASEFVSLHVSSLVAQTVDIEIKDVSGKVVSDSKNNAIQPGENRINMQLQGLAKGFYLIRLKTVDNFYIKKLIID